MRPTRLLVCAALCASAWLALSRVHAEDRAAPSEGAGTASQVEPSGAVSPTISSASSETARSNVTPDAANVTVDAQKDPALEPLPPRKRLWDWLKALPIFFYSPETSFGFGAGLLLQFDMPGAVARRPSSITLGSVYTLENQVSAQFTPELRFGHDDYVLKLDLVGARYPSRFYGMGNDGQADDFDPFIDCYFRGELDFRMRPFSEGHRLRPLFVGMNHQGVWSHMKQVEGETTKFDTMHDRGEQAFVAVGLGPSLAWDSRDSLSWPTKGSFVDTKFTVFDPLVGSDLRYRRLSIDLRHFQKIWFEHILALRFVSQAVWGEVPFQRLPQLGGASLFRGWYGGQLRERLMLAAEAEYRVPIGKRWAVVGFGSVGRVARNVKHFDLRELRFAGGAGLRFSVDKRDRVNIRADAAFGGNYSNPAFYLQFREAF
jgi:hypothetical protein